MASEPSVCALFEPGRKERVEQILVSIQRGKLVPSPSLPINRNRRYSYIEADTFSTVWLPLPTAVAEILAEGPHRKLPTDPCLLAFEEEIDKVILTLYREGKPGPFFARLSTRSPKGLYYHGAVLTSSKTPHCGTRRA
jgi:hypothetical protein